MPDDVTIGDGGGNYQSCTTDPAHAAISEAARAFLSTNADFEPFCVLHAETQQIIGATPGWLEKAGITREEAMAANS
eukprot:g15133.t1